MKLNLKVNDRALKRYFSKEGNGLTDLINS